ncbi:MAG: TonB family protein [Gemmatimonadetes bacterium]|nr:TonB family protein [Gemmatimonadota bacterium]NIO33132.1 TonB family protein [Gemmatimonadota bacterium]
MIALWIVYCLFISLMLCVAALAAERGLDLYGRPLRWVWLAALSGSIGLPLVAMTFPAWRGLPKVSLQPALVTVIEGITLAAGSSSAVEAPGATLIGLDGALIVLWLLSSVALAVFFVRSYVRLRGESRGWSRKKVGARTVLVSGDRGPAVTGFFRGAIVLPSWALEMEEEVGRIILLHEEEHLRAGDQRLLGLGLVALVLAPWNLPLWWQVRRLRLAIELDCDGRVLQRGAHPRRYGNLLLEVGRRASGISLLPTTFSEAKTFFERRVDNMTRGTPNHRILKATLAAALAAGLFAVACETPTPEGPTEQRPAESAATSLEPPPADLDELRAEPHFTPYTVRPEIQDREAAIDIVLQHYPDELKRAGVGGTVYVFIFIEADGTVGNAVVDESSGNEELDAAALDAAREIEFTPARNLDETVPVWVAFPIVFQAPEESSQQVSIIKGLPMAPATTVNSGQKPLVIVDGVVVSDEFDFDDVMADLHARGVDSVEIIKRSAATALGGPTSVTREQA